jgi:uncharacterized 2Fe-2S/4Fe-4S cluster protein (DUF4445 family)
MGFNTDKIIVDFEPISRRVILSLEKTFYETLVDMGVKIQSLCGGQGTCGKCKLKIQKGLEFLTPPTQSEKKFINKEQFDDGWRLACQVKVDKQFQNELIKKSAPHIRVFLSEELLVEDFKILTQGISKEINFKPNIQKIFLEVREPSLEHHIADFERIITSLKLQNLESLKLEVPEIELNLLKNLNTKIRKSNHNITVTIEDNRKIIDIEPENTEENNFGIAFDIGTTTIVGYLINLNNGKIYATSSKLNPQTAFGEDLITRINYIKEHQNGLEKLNKSVLEAVNDIIGKLIKKAQIKKSNIYETTVDGNAVMHHIFLGLNPLNIGLSPYVPILQHGININANKLNLNVAKNANTYVLPTIAGFVGADTMGVILASQIDQEEKLTLALDIGTNGELVIGNKDLLITGSCAAGSALEGAHIKHGMRAAAGSIDSLKIDSDPINISYTTIKNKKPLGICGSGLIDAIAELIRNKIITRSGSFNKKMRDSRYLQKNDGQYEFILVDKTDTLIDENIVITQDDIRQIQMAKAAFYSGAKLMLNSIKDDNLEIEQIFLAGAFGNYIDKRNAKFIGMIPDIPDDEIFQIGNAAGIGAQHCLINKDLREKCHDILKKVNYVEIAIQEKFQREYAEAMYFPHMKLENFPSLEAYEDIPIK